MTVGLVGARYHIGQKVLTLKGSGTVTHIDVDDEGYETLEMFWVNCEECRLETELYYTPEEAYEAWNNCEVKKI